jgi:hypothetical protein
LPQSEKSVYGNINRPATTNNEGTKDIFNISIQNCRTFIPITRAYILFNIGPYVITMHKKMGKEHPTAPQYFAQGNMATKLNNEANITIIVFLFILLYAINMEFPRFCIEGIVVHTKIIKVM